MLIAAGISEIHIVPESKIPDLLDAIVVEQDTSLLLGMEPEIQIEIEDYPSLINDMKQQKPRIPGQVLVKHSTPRKLIAIIYDLEQQPVCQLEWVMQAIKNIIEICKKYKIETLAMPLPGCRHGKLDPGVILEQLQKTVSIANQNYPEKIYIQGDKTIVYSISTEH